MKQSLLLLAGLALVSATAQAQWVNQPIPSLRSTQINFAISAVDANVAWTTVLDTRQDFGGAQQVSRTLNGGAAWTTAAIPGLAADEVITSLFAQGAATAWATVAKETAGGGRVLRTTDGGTTWTAQTSAAQFSGRSSYPVLVRFFDATNGVAVGDPVNNAFEIYTTADAGATWTTVPAASLPAPTLTEYADAGLPLVAQVGNTIWVGTDEGRVLRSTDRGRTWAVAATGIKSLQAIAFRDASNGLAMNEDGNFARTTDGGSTWTRFTPTGPFHPIGLDNVPGTRTYVSTGAGEFGPGSSFSTDDGQTWTAIESTVNHFLVDFVSPTVGWSGGLRVDAAGGAVGGNGMNKYVGTALATNEAVAAQWGVSSFPNPSADGRFTVRGTGLPAAAAVRVLDRLGRLVWEQTWRSPQTAPLQLDLGSRPAGVYVLEISTPAGPVRQKLVMQ